MDEVLFTNIRLKRDTRYFIYVGELKAYPLNAYLRETLSRLYHTAVDFLAIIPDVLARYDTPNVMVINPVAQKLAGTIGKPVNCRIAAEVFAFEVSRHPAVIALIERLRKNQPEILVYQFESVPELTLERFPGVRMIGPRKDLSRRWNNKIYQHHVLKGVLPLADFEVCEGFLETLGKTEHLLSVWTDGVHISLESGGGGSNSCVVLPSDDVDAKVRRTFGGFHGPYLLSRFIPHKYDPTVLAVVANEADVCIGGVADQQIEDLNKFKGSTFPSVLPKRLLARLREYTKRVGRVMGKSGYRGIFGCDFLIDGEENVIFLEINARKQGTTMEMCCTAENALPIGSPSLPELEYRAVTENRFPSHTAEIAENTGRIHWGTYNYKLDRDISTNGHTPPLQKDERTMFQDIAGARSEEEAFCIVESIGSNHVVKAGAFLGRVVSVATHRSGVDRGLTKGREQLEKTIGDVIP